MLAAPLVALEDPWVRWDWISDHTDDIRQRLVEHVETFALALVIGVALALPLGLACYRYGRLYPPVLTVAGVLYSIPSLAFFAFLWPFFGFGRPTTQIPLVAYSMLILVRNVVAGLQGVPPEVVESARGMGYSERAVLLRVQLPLAVPAVMAGIRVTAVTTIGLVTIAAVIGQGGLGRFLVDGINRSFRTPIVVGTVLAIGLSFVVDALLLLVQRRMTPWTRVRSS